jgi:hypothetical protein
VQCYENWLLAVSYLHVTAQLPLDRFSWNVIVLRDAQESVSKTQDWLKSDSNNRYCTWHLMHIYDNLYKNSCWNDKFFRQMVQRKWKHILSSVIFFFQNIVPLSDMKKKKNTKCIVVFLQPQLLHDYAMMLHYAQIACPAAS